MKPRRRLSRADHLRLKLPSVLPFVVALGLVLALGWLTARARNPSAEECNRLYARAATPADSATVDAVPVRSRGLPGYSCGYLRRRAFLKPAPRPVPAP